MYDDEQRIISAEFSEDFDSEDNENVLRPKQLSEYVGQEKIKANLSVFMESAKKRGECLDHCLLYGPPGLGKTTLSHIIANEMNADIKMTSGPAIEKAGDLAAILSNLQQGDVLFIDEIHRMNHCVEEMLYPAMEDFGLDMVLGKGPSARTIRIPLKKFTLIGATTKAGMLSSPLRDRFGVIFRLEMYRPEELAKIITRSAKILNILIEPAASIELASRSRGTPRIANRLLKRVRDFAEYENSDTITLGITQKALDNLEIDKLGLDKTDIAILDSIINKFNGGPVGLDTLAAITGEDSVTIEDVYEPYLMQLGFMQRTPRGRVCTRLSYEHLNIPMPKK